MSRSIDEILRGEGILVPELVEKAQEVKDGLVKLAKEVPEEHLDVAALTGAQCLSPATRKILALTARIEGEAQDSDDYSDERMINRRSIAANLRGRAKSLRITYALASGESIPDYIEDEALTSDMNEISFRTIITPELHRCRRGPASFGEVTTDIPVFPLHGAILDLPNNHSRDIFAVIVTYKGKSRKLPFFVDTGGKQSYANKQVLRLLKPDVDLDSWTAATALRVQVHGIETDLHLGQPDTSVEEVNLLGSMWLEAGGLALVCDYSKKGRGCALIKGDDPVPRTIREAAPSVIEDLVGG